MTHSLIPPGRVPFLFSQNTPYSHYPSSYHRFVFFLNMSASLHKTGLFENRGLFLLNSWSQSTPVLWTLNEIIPRKRYTFQWGSQWGSRSFNWMNALFDTRGRSCPIVLLVFFPSQGEGGSWFTHSQENGGIPNPSDWPPKLHEIGAKT